MNTNTKLQSAMIMVFDAGHLQIGTQGTPVNVNNTAEIIISNLAINTGTDAQQYGTGLLAWGRVTMFGSTKTPTFVRTSVEPMAGNTQILLEQAPSGWRVGDRIMVPDTRQVDEANWFNPDYVLEVEERFIQSISGSTITLNQALSHDHRGARDVGGAQSIYQGIKLLPHIANLTRNIIIRSENPNGTRGHTLFTSRANVNINYVQFQDLGRTRAVPLDSVTNHIGRYPLHAHHLWGPINPSNTGYQFRLVGNAINDSLKWPMAIHASHYGLIQQNIIYGGAQLTGAGIAIEDGSETENLFDSNFVGVIRGNVSPRSSGPTSLDGGLPGSAAECFWAAGFNNRFTNNVATDCRNSAQEIVSGPCWKLITHPAPFQTKNPRFRGADMNSDSEYILATVQYQPITEFRGNECYGISAAGLTIWSLGTSGYEYHSPMGESLIKDLRVWNTYFAGVWNYPINRVTIDNMLFRVDPNVGFCCDINNRPPAIQNGDYRAVDLTIRGGSFHAGELLSGSLDMLGTVLVENVSAMTTKYGFSFHTPATPGTGASRSGTGGVTVNLRNNVITPWPGLTLKTIETVHDLRYGAASQPNETYNINVYDYQGQSGNNFRVFFDVQATENYYGGLATCNDTTTRPEVEGITCNIGGSTPPPPPTPVVGDINLDHIVNTIDYSILNLDWFTTNSRSDLNHDGLVNAIDYSLLNANWLRTW